MRARSTLPLLLVGFNVFVAGGCLALLLVRQLLLTILDRLISVQAQAEILNVLDQLLPYYVWYAAALAVSLALTLTVWAVIWLRRRRRLTSRFEGAYGA